MAFGGGNPLHAENAPGSGGPAAQNPPEGSTRPNFSDQLQSACAIPPFKQTGVSRHTQRGAHFNRIQAQIIDCPIQLRDGIEIVDAQIGAHQANGFVFKRRNQRFTICAAVIIRAADGAARHTGVGCFALTATRHQQVAHILAADLFGGLKFTAGEVTRRQRAKMVGHIGHGGSAIVGVGFYLRMAGEGFAISFLGGAEGGKIRNRGLLAI